MRSCTDLHVAVFVFIVISNSYTSALQQPQYDCQTYNCPAERPLCTPVGCLSNCPKDSYERNGRCVVTCGDGYAMGERCEDECPATAANVVEKVVVNGGSFEKLRICVDVCSNYDPTFASYKGKCVNTCPPHASFQLENTCVSKCPLTHPYWYKYEIPERDFSVIQCMHICPQDKMYLAHDNRTCVDACPNNEVLVDGRCMDTCPNASYALLNGRCVLGCNYEMLLQNKTCVFRCAREMEFVYNRTCLTKCPASVPYFDPYFDPYNGQFEYLECKQNCGNKVSKDWKCVDKCPKQYAKFNQTCVLTCPSSAPYNEVSPWYSDDNAKLCVKQCSYNKVAVNYTCMNRCPGKQVVFNQICTDHCPRSAPYTASSNSGTNRHCLQHCPSKQFVHNFTCVENCPKFVFQNICVSVCPTGTASMDKNCYTDCPRNTYMFNGTECRDCELHYLTHCVTTCPDQRPYNNGGICVKQCPGDRISINNICTDEYNCKKSVRYKGQCLNSCPSGTITRMTNEEINDIKIYTCMPLLHSALFTALLVAAILTFICVIYFRFWPLPCIESQIKRAIRRMRGPAKRDNDARPSLEDMSNMTSDTANLVI